MGLDSQALKFILESGRAEDCFSSVVTLGRQELQHFDNRSLSGLLGKHGRPCTETQAGAILQGAGGFAEPLFRHLGATRVDSIDNSGYENASIIHDMNTPIPDHLKSSFRAVIDGGCLEHIFNFPTAIANCMQLLEVGGRFLSSTVCNNFMGHGFYQFSPELFFRVFDRENGFETERVTLYDPEGGARCYSVTDPRRVGGRVEAVTKSPVYLLVQARKVADVPVFTTAPQQSDYAQAWGQAPVDGSVAEVHRNGKAPMKLARLKGLVKKGSPRYFLDLYRNYRDLNYKKQYDSKVFTAIK